MTRIEKLNREIEDFEGQIKERREAIKQVQEACPHPEGLSDSTFHAEEDEYGSTERDRHGKTIGYERHECHLCGKIWVEEDADK